jgi:hypothetical protein
MPSHRGKSIVLDAETRRFFEAVVDADRRMAEHLERAAACLRDGIDPDAVAESLDHVAQSVRQSIARNQEMLG